MVMGDVVGRLWSARHAERLTGEKLLLIRPLALGAGGALRATTKLVVAVDRLGAGPGERVLIAHGSRVRDLTVGVGIPDKDVVIAIVDDHDLPVATGPGSGKGRS